MTKTCMNVKELAYRLRHNPVQCNPVKGYCGCFTAVIIILEVLRQIEKSGPVEPAVLQQGALTNTAAPPQSIHDRKRPARAAVSKGALRCIVSVRVRLDGEQSGG
ncbi:hypothetical protein MHYP_G00347660 [Metynnis hypsauchen]